MQPFTTHSLLASLDYKPVKKKKLIYRFYDLEEGMMTRMPKLSYGVNPSNGVIVITVLPDGKETRNTANQGDIIMCGVSGEKYVIRAEKFSKLYEGSIGKNVHPEQSDRMVARYDGQAAITFRAPWGEDMILRKGDYVVREKDGSGFYRIAKVEFEKTYNTLR